MYTLENNCCDIIGFDKNGNIGFYRSDATQVVFDNYDDAVAFIDYLEKIGKYTSDILIVKF